MKPRGPGTHIFETVETPTFKDKEYLVLNAKYKKAVGTDIWYFYFDTDINAIGIYQFLNKIKIPKVRAWYYSTDNSYLGSDVLE